MKTFAKDLTNKYIPAAQAEKDADAFIAEIQQALDEPVDSDMVTAAEAMQTLYAPLPIHVQRFTAEIEKNFERTATNLEIVATRLENAAKDLRKRATDLRDASPQVQRNLESWITFERKSSERSKFLNTLFEDIIP